MPRKKARPQAKKRLAKIRRKAGKRAKKHTYLPQPPGLAGPGFALAMAVAAAHGLRKSGDTPG